MARAGVRLSHRQERVGRIVRQSRTEVLFFKSHKKSNLISQKHGNGSKTVKHDYLV